MDVNGLSIKDIINMDFADIQKLTRKELATVTSRLVSASNKRIRRLEKSELGEAPSIRSLKVRTGEDRLSVKGKSQGQLQRTFTEAKHFLNLKTSTIGGYKKVIKNIKKTISERIERNVTELDVSKLYSTLHKAQELGLVDKRGSKGSEQAVNEIIDILERNPDKGIDDIINDIDDWYTEMYEEDFNDNDEEDDDIFFDDRF